MTDRVVRWPGAELGPKGLESGAVTTVRYRPDELQIEVRDDGEGSSRSDGHGHGLVGIRERVKIYGGDMNAGSANGSGFILSTRLPLSAGRR